MAKATVTFDLATIHKAVEWKLLKSLAGKRFCQTGTMSCSRAQMDQLIVAVGATPDSTVKQATDYLIVPNDPAFRKGSKYKAAEASGTTIITEEEFCMMIMPTENELRTM